MEISTWVDQQLISAEQARSICKLYGVEFDELGRRSTAYRILVILGFLFVGLALITLIGANWETIPRGVRMAGLLALTAGTHGLATWHYGSARTSLAVGLFMLGNLFYGASIILIAQIYHLGEHIPDGVFWWALGSLPFAVLLHSAVLMLFTGLLALLWYYLEFSTGFLTPVFLLTAFPLFIAAELYVLTKSRTNTPLFLIFVISLGLWFEILLSMIWMDSRGRLEFFAEHVFVSVALFILAYSVSRWLHLREGAKEKDYGAVLSLWTLRFALLGLLALSFEYPWTQLIEAEWNNQLSMWFVVTGLAATALWIGWKTAKLPVVLSLTILSGCTMIAVIVADVEVHAVYLQVLANIALITAGIGLIVRGTVGGVSHYFFLGVAVILLTAFVRYVDLIGDYVNSAILFMGLAALLLGAARYWKVRQSKEARG